MPGQTWSLTLWVGRILGPETEEVAGGWRTLHNEELHNLYTSPYVIRVIKSRKMRSTGHTARMEEITEGTRSLETPRRKREGNIRMDLRKIVWEGVEWMHLAQDRDQWRAVVNTVMNILVP
jgi:hypothetical protein